MAPRIEEILLEQQVNVMFGTWLDNLRKQGDVEVLDPARVRRRTLKREQRNRMSQLSRQPVATPAPAAEDKASALERRGAADRRQQPLSAALVLLGSSG